MEHWKLHEDFSSLLVHRCRGRAGAFDLHASERTLDSTA